MSAPSTARGGGGFDLRWVLHAAIILLPITLLGAYFLSVSMELTGYPIAASGVVSTHYQREPVGTYPPLLNLLNGLVGRFMPLPLWWALYALFVCFYMPFCVLYAISGRFELPAFFLYGTALGVNNLLIGLLPQALMVNLGLLVWWKPVLAVVLLPFSFIVHNMAPLLILAVLGLRLFYAND